MEFLREARESLRRKEPLTHPGMGSTSCPFQTPPAKIIPSWTLSSMWSPGHPSEEAQYPAPTNTTAPPPPPTPPPPAKVSLIFSLPWIQVIAPCPLSQAPRNVTNSLPSFTGPVTWEVFIARQPPTLPSDSAAFPLGHLSPTQPTFGSPLLCCGSTTSPTALPSLASPPGHQPPGREAAQVGGG